MLSTIYEAMQLLIAAFGLVVAIVKLGQRER